MRGPIRVLLVDSPALLRRSLALLLSRRRRLEIAGEAGNGTEALAQIRANAIDVVLVDPAVPEGGPKLVADLCGQDPSPAVVVLTAGAQHGAVARMLQQGVRGYLEKDCDIEAVARCIERVYAGEVVIGPTAADSLPQDFTAFRRPAAADLTHRELEVLRLVADGRTNAEVGKRLYITEHTVKSHLARMLGKLGFDNRVQLATFAAQQSIVAPPIPSPDQ